MPLELVVSSLVFLLVFSTLRLIVFFSGVGDAVMNQFRVIEYSYDTVNVFDDTNGPLGNPDHPLMKGVAYVDKGIQPTTDPCLGSLLKKYYGFVDNLFRFDSISAKFHQ